MLCPAYCVPFARCPFPKCRNAPRAAHRCRCWYTGAYDGIRTRSSASKPIHSRRRTAGVISPARMMPPTRPLSAMCTVSTPGSRSAASLRVVSASPPMKALTNESSSGLFLQHYHNIAEGVAPALRHCHGLLRAGEGVGMADEALDRSRCFSKSAITPGNLWDSRRDLTTLSFLRPMRTVGTPMRAC